MWDIIKSIIASPAGSFGFVVGVLFLAGWIIAKISKVVTIANMKSQNVDKLENNLDTIKQDIQVIKATLDVMQSGKSSLTKSHSPVSLTSLGEDIAKQMGIYDMIARNWPMIYDNLVKNVSSKNAYDVQQYCINTATVSLEKFFCPEDVDRIKMFAYNNGNPIAYYGSMIGVIIRDKYFEVVGIDVKEVDKCEMSSR